MTGKFQLRALGRGSVASLIQLALSVSWWVLWGAAALLAVGIVAYVVVLILIAAGQLDASVLTPQERTEHSYGPVKVIVEQDETLIWPVVAPAFLAGLVAISGALIILQRLRRLFRNFTSGAPFSADNAGHLRVIWVTMLVMELSRYAIAGAVSLLVMIFGQPDSTDVSVEAPVNFMTWGAILILIVLAEVFREGARMREEQDLTI